MKISLEKYYGKNSEEKYRISVPPRNGKKAKYYPVIFERGEDESPEKFHERAVMGFNEYVEKRKNQGDNPRTTLIMEKDI